MKYADEVGKLMGEAYTYAASNGYEYVVPEILLLKIAMNDTFEYAFIENGGNCELLADDLTDYLESYVEKVPGDVATIASQALEDVAELAEASAINSGAKQIELSHIIHGIYGLEDSYAKYYMERQGVMEADLLSTIAEFTEAMTNPSTEDTWYENYMGMDYDVDPEICDGEYPVDDEAVVKPGRSDSYAPCLNDTLKDVNPLIGREEELERTIQILCRKDKNNPLHIGEPGVGKTAITYGLVQMIRENKVPDVLKGARVFALDLAGMLAGTQYRGDFEKRFKQVLEVIARAKNPIIYIDEIHNLSGAGATKESSFDASNLLKPYLAAGTIRFIGATTFDEYKKYFEKDKSLVRRFQNVEIKEPSIEETIEILEGLKSKYESFHRIKYGKGVLEYAVRMSAKHINERFLPDKAIDLIDEAGAYRKLNPTNKKIQTVSCEDINAILTKICRVPIETVETDNLAGLEQLEDRMRSKVFGQDEAVSQVVNAVKFSKAGLLEENKPLASILFVGPTGVGKTEIAKQLSQELGVKLVRFDMSEYGEKHAVAKLIGAPAGYVGYEEGGLLTEAIRKNPSCVLLLDEIEKAHSDIYNILLQVMDYATLTDNQGRKADFRNVIIIMTSNAGANLVGKAGIGFTSTARDNSAIMDTVKQTFQPEFRNRLNKIVVFNSMDDSMATLVVDKKLRELANQLEAKKIILEVDASAKALIKEKGVSLEFGAREVDRVIRNDIKPLFVDEILFGKLKKGGKLVLVVDDKNFSYKVK